MPRMTLFCPAVWSSVACRSGRPSATSSEKVLLSRLTALSRNRGRRCSCGPSPASTRRLCRARAASARRLPPGRRMARPRHAGVSTRHFLGLTHSNLNHLARSALGHRDEKALRAKLSEDQIWGLLSEQTLPLVAALETPNHGPAGGLNLAPVLLAGSFGDIETVGVRIPLTAINAWWVGSFRHIPRRTSGGGGVSVEF